MTVRLRGLAGMGAISALLLTACSAPAAEPVSSEAPTEIDLAELERLAKEEGQVVWYTRSLPHTVHAVAAAFADEYGIEVINGMSSGTDLAQVIESDVRSTGTIAGDLITTSDYDLTLHLRQEGLTQSASPDWFPEVDPEFMVDDAGVVCSIQVPIIAYNTDLVGDLVLESWEDLLDPRLKGMILVNDPRSSPTWQHAWSTVLHASQLGEDYIEAIAMQEFQPVGSPLVGKEQIIAGQGAVSMFGVPGLYAGAAEEGFPLDYFIPNNPSLSSPNFCAVVTDSPNPNAGMLFARWLLGEDGQTVLNAGDMSASPLGDLQGATPRPADYAGPMSAEQLQSNLPVILELLGMQ